MTRYQKPYLAISDQLALLKQRGMVVTDDAKAQEYLARIGYYRLSAYWYPFRQETRTTAPGGSVQKVVGDAFKPDVEFQTIVDLYVFDKRLRLLMLDVLERIEVALRTDVALQLGQHDPYAHRDPVYLDGRFAQRTRPSRSKHSDWLGHLDERARKSKEQFAEHFRQKYPRSRMPIWIAVELMDFGPLSHLITGMKTRDVRVIADHYAIPRPELLPKWVWSLSIVRNICAHHSRLWNKPLVNQVKPPRPGEMSALDHLASDRFALSRLYGAVAVARHMLHAINPSTSWPERLKALVATFPANAHVSFRGSGFPAGWEQQGLWQ